MNNLKDRADLTDRFTNVIDAQCWIDDQARNHFGYVRITDDIRAEVGEFKRNLLQTKFSRFSKCNIYKILMGEVKRDARAYNYQPHPF